MLNINFVPDDYVQSSESQRTNLMYLVLLAVVMVALGGLFITIRIRQRILCNEVANINAEMTREGEDLKKLGELQTKQKEMMKTALTTSQLLEPVPKSVLLASLTNNLPAGVSLLRLYMIQKEIKQTAPTPAQANKYQAAQVNPSKIESPQRAYLTEKPIETLIDISGIAPSDLQVADYIERLSNSSLLATVALVESTEHKVEDTTFRQFKLTAVLRNNIHLSPEDLDRIRAEREDMSRGF
jgi:Tfp pilus assembly protein PilN